MYQGFYVNMDKDVARRKMMEECLEKAGFAGKYTRFPAIDGNTITYGPDAVPGSSILGCTLSHLTILKDNPDPELHLHIVEDDVNLHPGVGRAFEAFVTQEHIQEWDVLMTDIFLPPDIYLFKYLHQKYQELAITGSITFLDIADFKFAGSTSYFVNKSSKHKILNLVEHGFSVETPYDIRIRSLAEGRKLKVYVCFPFLSTLSALNDTSTMAGSVEHVLPLLEYRRSFYIEPDLEAINKNLSNLDSPAPDLQMQIYLNMVKFLLSPEHKSC
jgi:GR25 family glycosyltransferase involved in LPS biosynthesis